jgi:hypothetical protein
MLHGAFFLGPKSFYRALREMPAEQLARIQMMPVSFTNQLYGDEEAKRRARVDARFVNTAMMATLMGGAISDGLENGQVVSGVGGQYNFVAQAFALQARGRSSRWKRRGRRAQDAFQHPLELRPPDHPAASARRVRHRIRRRRCQGKIGRRDHRGDAAVTDSRFQDELAKTPRMPARAAEELKFRAPSRELSERIAQALKPAREAGLSAVIPVRHRLYWKSSTADPSLQLLREAQRTPLRLPDCCGKDDTTARTPEHAMCLAAARAPDRPKTFASADIRALVFAALGAEWCGVVRPVVPRTRGPILRAGCGRATNGGRLPYTETGIMGP